LVGKLSRIQTIVVSNKSKWGKGKGTEQVGKGHVEGIVMVEGMVEGNSRRERNGRRERTHLGNGLTLGMHFLNVLAPHVFGFLFNTQPLTMAKDANSPDDKIVDTNEVGVIVCVGAWASGLCGESAQHHFSYVPCAKE
jgi:hypothetical protein